MVICLTASRMNMNADILKQGYGDPVQPTDTDGEWVEQQDPDSGEIIRKWQPNDRPVEGPVDSETLQSFPCVARGITNGGLKSAGTTERFGELYDGVDYVLVNFPASVIISRRDRITNIRDNKGNVIWREEDVPSRPATLFSVTGVVPIIDPFGRHTENQMLLERAEVQ